MEDTVSPKSKSKKKKGRRKTKIIETTKTTQFLITAHQMANYKD
jgi:hypothetical protein